jgi:hypothetical protein
MWTVVAGPEQTPPLADHERYRYVIEQEDDRRDLYVELSGSVVACGPSALPHPMSEDVATKGRSAVERYIAEPPEPPEKIVVTTSGSWASVRPTYRAA